MINIHEKTLQDIEFKSVLKQVSDLCITDLGRVESLEIKPLTTKENVLQSLDYTNEFVSSFYNDNRIPNHGFEPITQEIKLLKIENSYLDTKSFKKIASITLTISDILKFLKKFEEYYPSLYASSAKLEVIAHVVTEIDAIIDRFGDIKDNATDALYKLRQSINSIRGKINISFNAALTQYHNLDYLDDIRESVVENKRVLAVKAMYRRKVKGSIMGSSRTGSIVYIQPEQTFQYARELNNLEFDEGEEVDNILRNLTEYIRPYVSLLNRYQEFLLKLDVIYAKAKHAQSINGILPTINDEKIYSAQDAYHPLLYLSNKAEGKKTYSQSIVLHPENRIIVISGPNAGGKSITLKTIGLMQVMLQSGMLIPVHEKSNICLFDRIISDIGDNLLKII
jgi:DNA mismatch repair protein MutS2